MATDMNGFPGIIRIDSVRTLNPMLDPQSDGEAAIVVAAIWCVGRRYIFTHAIPSGDFYDPFARQCTIILLEGEDSFAICESVLKRTGLRMGSWNWVDVDLSNTIADFSTLLNNDRAPHADQSSRIISIYQNPDVLKLVSDRDTVTMLTGRV